MLRILREIELNLESSQNVATACRSTGSIDATNHLGAVGPAGGVYCIWLSRRLRKKRMADPKRTAADFESDNLSIPELKVAIFQCKSG